MVMLTRKPQTVVDLVVIVYKLSIRGLNNTKRE
jgi:hypothetical protein